MRHVRQKTFGPDRFIIIWMETLHSALLSLFNKTEKNLTIKIAVLIKFLSYPIN